jgi:hypothetical protein
LIGAAVFSYAILRVFFGDLAQSGCKEFAAAIKIIDNRFALFQPSVVHPITIPP